MRASNQRRPGSTGGAAVDPPTEASIEDVSERRALRLETEASIRRSPPLVHRCTSGREGLKQLNCWLMLFNREEQAKVETLKHTTLATARLRFLFLAAKIWRHAGSRRAVPAMLNAFTSVPQQRSRRRRS